MSAVLVGSVIAVVRQPAVFQLFMCGHTTPAIPQGTLQNPYRTLRDAILGVATGGTVNLLPGEYVGPDNIGIKISGIARTLASGETLLHAALNLIGIEDPTPCLLHSANPSIRPEMCTGPAILDGSSQQGSVLQLESTTVVIQKLQIANGSASNGGAVYATSSSLSLRDCIFAGNRAVYRADATASLAGSGGALSLHGASSLKAEFTNFTSNTAIGMGGAVLLATTPSSQSGIGAVIITQCHFEGNSALEGGAVHIQAALSLEVLNSQFKGNVAKSTSYTLASGGGALSLQPTFQMSKIHIVSSSFVNNEAQNDNYISQGGAVKIKEQPNCQRPMTTIFTGCVFEANRAQYGGALFSSAVLHSVHASKSAFMNNRVQDLRSTHTVAGAASYMLSATQFSDCTFVRNVAESVLSSQGGAVFHQAVTAMQQMTMARCTFEENTAKTGGGAYFASSIKGDVVSDCLLKSNHAYDKLAPTQGSAALTFGGAIVVAVNGLTSIRRTTFTSNTASWGGAAYTDRSSTPVFDTCTFEHNSATSSDGSGGAVAVGQLSHPYITKNTFVSNTGAFGAAISTSTGSGLLIQSSTFQKNAATQAGGVFYFSSCQHTLITDSEFTANGGLLKQGGGVLYSQAQCVPLFSACIFIGNVASKSEGGVARLYGPAVPDFRGCVFTKNSAMTSGGAVWLSGIPSGSITSCSFSENTVSTTAAGGAAIGVFGQSTISVQNSTFVRHDVPVSGSAVYIQNSDSNFTKCTFELNTATRGAVHTTEETNALWQECRFVNNAAKSLDTLGNNGGGAMHLGGIGKDKVMNCHFRGNKAVGNSSGGGAIFVGRLAQLQIIGQYHGLTTFEDNHASRGGAVCVTSKFASEVHQCTFSRNTASTFGGSINIDGGGHANITGSTFHSNSASDSGGALSTGNMASLTVQTSMFETNSAGHFGGAFFYDRFSIETEPPKNVTFLRNKAAAGAGVFWAMREAHNQGLCLSCNFTSNTATDYGNNLATDIHRVQRLDAVPIPFRGGVLMNPPVQVLLLDFFSQQVANRRNGDGARCVIHFASALKHVIGPTVDFSNMGAVSFLGVSFSGVWDMDYQVITKCKWTRCIGEEVLDFESNTNTTIYSTICLPGERTSFDPLRRTMCTACKTNSYAIHKNSTECSLCPKGMQCDGGSHVITEEGYWSHPAERDKAYRCAPSAACLGGELSLCKEGHHGRVCGICEEGYMKTAAGCRQCGGVGIWKPMITVAVLLVLVLIAGAIAAMCMQYDPHGDENKIVALSRIVDTKKAKFARAKSLGDPLKMAEGKAQLKVAQAELDAAIEESERNNAEHDAVTTQNPLIPIAGPGVTPNSDTGKGAGGGVIDEAEEEQEQQNGAGGRSGGNNDGAEDGEMGVDESPEAGVDAEGVDAEGIDAEALADFADFGDVGALGELSVVGKILVGYCQTAVSSCITMPSVPWPSGFVNAFVVMFSFISFDFMNIIPLGCMMDLTFYADFMLTIYTPLILIVLVQVATAGKYLLDKKKGDTKASDSYKDNTMKFSLLVLFILFPSVSLKMCSMFDCREIYGQYWLRADVQLQCYDDVWTSYAVVATAGVLVYPIGIPLLFCTILMRNLSQLGTPGMRARFGFLYSGFMVVFWFGELVEMVRKFFMTAFVIFVAPGSLTQIGAALLVSATFLGMHLYYNPYENPMENRTQSIALWGMTITMLIGFLLTANGCSVGSDIQQGSPTEALLPPLLLFANMFSIFGTISVVFFDLVINNFERLVEMLETFNEEFLEPLLNPTDVDPDEMENELEEEQVALVGMGAGATATVGATALSAALSKKDLPSHVLMLAEKVFDYYRADVDCGIDRKGFLRFMTRWDHTEYTTLGKTETLFQTVCGGFAEINETAFKLYCGDQQMFLGFTASTCQYAIELLCPETNTKADGVPVYRKLWISQLFNMHARSDQRGSLINYQSFYQMMKNFSPDVNPALVKATFKQMAEVAQNRTQGAQKQRMADAIKVRAGSRELFEDVENDHDVLAQGIKLDQFVKWAASVFMNCEASEFIEGISEMMKTDGAELRRQAPTAHVDEEEEEDEEDEPPQCGPVITVDFVELFQKIDMQPSLNTMISEARYSIWRSLKGRQLVMDMCISAQLIFQDIAAQIEHQRRQQTQQTNVLVVAEAWPPLGAEAIRVAKVTLNVVFDRYNADWCADRLRKRLVLEYIPQVNRTSFASLTLRDQMQALVLATSEVLVAKVSEEAFVLLEEAYRQDA